MSHDLHACLQCGCWNLQSAHTKEDADAPNGSNELFQSTLKFEKFSRCQCTRDNDIHCTALLTGLLAYCLLFCLLVSFPFLSSSFLTFHTPVLFTPSLFVSALCFCSVLSSSFFISFVSFLLFSPLLSSLYATLSPCLSLFCVSSLLLSFLLLLLCLILSLLFSLLLFSPFC